MKDQKLNIYKATVKTAFGSFVVAVESTVNDARSDIFTASLTAFHCSAGMLKVGDVHKNGQIFDFAPVKGCTVNGKHWAWIVRS